MGLKIQVLKGLSETFYEHSNVQGNFWVFVCSYGSGFTFLSIIFLKSKISVLKYVPSVITANIQFSNSVIQSVM